MPKSTDAEKILEHLLKGNSITFNDCQKLFGSNSVRERIRDLRRQGHNIITTKAKNEATGRYHAVYFIAEPAPTPHEEALCHAHLAQELIINNKAIQLEFMGVRE